MKEYYEDIEEVQKPIDFGCGFCWDTKKQTEKELYFLDRANNMRICLFCPYCGRKYNKGDSY